MGYALCHLQDVSCQITYLLLITTKSRAQQVLFAPSHHYYACTVNPGCQRGSKVISDSPRLVDFAKNTIFNLLDGQVIFLGELHKYCNTNFKMGLKCFSSLSDEVESAKTSISLHSMPD